MSLFCWPPSVDIFNILPRLHWQPLLKEDNSATSDPILFTVTYDPALPNIHDILLKKQPILPSTERLRNIFKEVPVVPFRRSSNLRDLLFRAKRKRKM